MTVLQPLLFPLGLQWEQKPRRAEASMTLAPEPVEPPVQKLTAKTVWCCSPPEDRPRDGLPGQARALPRERLSRHCRFHGLRFIHESHEQAFTFSIVFGP